MMTDNHELDAGLYDEAKHGRPQKLRELIRLGANVNYQNNSGWTALHNAALEGHLHCVEILVEHQADIHIANNSDGTALYYALVKGSVAIVDYLVKRGADLNTQYGDYNALHVASFLGHLPLARYLLDMGIDINCPVASGLTALDLARENLGDHDQIIYFLKAAQDKKALLDQLSKPGHPALAKSIDTHNDGLVM